MEVPVVLRIGSGVPLWTLLQNESFGSSEAYATVGVARAAELRPIGDTAATEEVESWLLGAGATEAYVASATRGGITNNISIIELIKS